MRTKAAFLTCCFAAVASAQDAAILRQNTLEVGPFVGISYGVDHIRGMGGANATYSILPNLLLYGEYSYLPSIGHTITNANGAIFNIKLPLQDVNFGAHFRVRIPRTPLVPYAVAGVGLLHSAARQDTITTVAFGQVQSVVHSPVDASTDFAFNYGAGVRYYVRESFGFRAEFKGYRLTGGPLHNPPSTISGGLGVNNVYRATLGFFFQF